MASISDYLRDFGAPERAVPFSADFPIGRSGLAEFGADDLDGVIQEDDAVDIDALEAEAYQRGRSEAESEAAEEQVTLLEAERARHAEEIEAMRLRYEERLAEEMATRFRDLAAGLAASIGGQVAATLAPFLDEAVRERTVARLAAAIEQSLTDDETAEISVSGSPTLYEALARHFEQQKEGGVRFHFTPSDEADLTVAFDDTVFTTRLAEWSEALKEALA